MKGFIRIEYPRDMFHFGVQWYAYQKRFLRKPVLLCSGWSPDEDLAQATAKARLTEYHGPTRTVIVPFNTRKAPDDRRPSPSDPSQ